MPQIRSMNNRFHSEAKLPWSYDYPLANHIATYKSSANREMPLFPRLYPTFGYLRKMFPPRGLKYFLFFLSYRGFFLAASRLQPMYILVLPRFPARTVSRNRQWSRWTPMKLMDRNRERHLVRMRSRVVEALVLKTPNSRPECLSSSEGK